MKTTPARRLRNLANEVEMEVIFIPDSPRVLVQGDELLQILQRLQAMRLNNCQCATGRADPLCPEHGDPRDTSIDYRPTTA